jgi:two-component system cell cycle response regulator DivK
VAKRILVVEDNDLNRKLFCDLLRANGFEVEPVADGREAIAKTRMFMPDLVIMDIQLPEVSGMDLITAIKADDELKAIPILAVTAYAGKGDEESIRDAGAEGYLAKPVSIGPFHGGGEQAGLMHHFVKVAACSIMKVITVRHNPAMKLL